MEAILRLLSIPRPTVISSSQDRRVRDGYELRETVRELRRRFARGEIDAAAYEQSVQRLGLEHLDF
jgi:uncharacterized membrane protein